MRASSAGSILQGHVCLNSICTLKVPPASPSPREVTATTMTALRDAKKLVASPGLFHHLLSCYTQQHPGRHARSLLGEALGLERALKEEFTSQD